MEKIYLAIIANSRTNLFTCNSKASLTIIALLLILNDLLHAQPDLIPYRKGNKWGYVNKDGEKKISLKYSDAGIFCDGIAWVKKRGRYGYINKDGKKITPYKFREIEDFKNGFGHGESRNGSWYKISPKGKVIFNATCGSAFIKADNFKIFKVGGKYGLSEFFRRDYDTLIKPIYDSISRINSKEYLAAKKGDYWGLINKHGKEKTSFKYTTISILDHEVFIVKIINKFGIIDTNGREITLVVYDYLEGGLRTYGSRLYFLGTPEEGGFSFIRKAKRDGKWGFVDRKGKEICLFKYDLNLDFSDKIGGVKLNEKWGYINLNGEEICEIKYEKVMPFKGGLGRVFLNGKWGYIDSTGKEYFE